MIVSFYHLSSSPLEKALPNLLEKLIASDKRAVMFFADETHMLEVDKSLWSFSTNRVIPHGNEQEDYKEKQPLYLTTKEENPNKAEILIVVDGSTPAYASQFERLLDVFDGNHDTIVKAARQRWKSYKEAEHELAYYQQDASGKWEAKG